jgi:hypothetical protein
VNPANVQPAANAVGRGHAEEHGGCGETTLDLRDGVGDING